MGELHLVVTIAGRRAAIPGAQVQSVVELERIVPVPQAPPHIAGLAALRSRALTVVDARAALGLNPALWETEGRAAVTMVDGHAYAILVDKVEDVTEITGEPTPAGASLGPAWDMVAQGLVETPVGPAVLVDIAQLVCGSSTCLASGVQHNAA